MQPIRTAADGARTLESILVKQLIQDSGAFRGMSQAGGKIYGEMFCEALANAVSQSGGVGIAKLVEGSFEKGATAAQSGPSEASVTGDFLFHPATQPAASAANATDVTPEVFERFRRTKGPHRRFPSFSYWHRRRRAGRKSDSGRCARRRAPSWAARWVR